MPVRCILLTDKKSDQMTRNMNFLSEIEALYKDQFKHWPFLNNNYENLAGVRTRTIHLNGYHILIQYNPNRILSSSAKVDHQSINARPCFLCEKNRPEEQHGIMYDNGYILLINPYPVFSRHLTIPTVQHEPQAITGHFEKMLLLARDLEQYVMIYNGPQCGASAPDHFHFQAVKTELLPVQNDFSRGICLDSHGEWNGIAVYTWDKYLRNFITLKGKDMLAILHLFDRIYEIMNKSQVSAGEPMMNIIASFEQGNWVLHIYPRKRHRPVQFFEQGEKKILTSPGSIDLSGFFVMAREEDFNKITVDDIADIYQQVCLDVEDVQFIVNELI